MQWRRMLVAVSVVGLVAAGCGDDDAASDETTTTVETTPSSETTTTTEADDASDVAVDEFARLSGMPWASPDDAHEDPIAAVEAFMNFIDETTVGVLGGYDIGEYAAGDQRSGEVELRYEEPFTNPTTVFVRQGGPSDNWWVLGAEHFDLRFEEPQPDAAIGSPFDLVLSRAGGATFQIYASGSESLLYKATQEGNAANAVGPFVTSIDMSSCEDAPAIEDDRYELEFRTGPVFTNVTSCEGPGPAGAEGTLILSGTVGVTTLPVVFANP